MPPNSFALLRPALRGLCLLFLAVLGAGPAAAAQRTGDQFELAFVLWDPLAKTSYTLDLGLLDTDFFARGQDDAGFQRFWTLTPSTDANLARFRTGVTDPSQLRWGVMGFDDNALALDPGEVRLFTTLEQGTANGVRNVNYTKLLNNSNDTLITSVAGGTSRWLGEINSNLAGDALNTSAFRPGLTEEENYLVNGSSFAAQGVPGYFAAQGLEHLFVCDCALTNAVGKSSWFYYAANSSANTDDKVLIDEFDNLSADGYWGLAFDSASGNYILSYTLTASLLRAQALTDLGRARASLTEYRSGTLVRQIAAPGGEFAGYVPPSFAAVVAVPEPESWALFLAGIVAFLGRRLPARAFLRVSTRAPRAEA